MIFSRILIAAVTVVGLVAAQSQGSALDLSGIRIGTKLAPRDKDRCNDAMTKLTGLQAKVASAMAGPKEEREQQLITVTSSALDAVKEYNEGYKSRISLLSVGAQNNGDDLKKFGKTLYHILRSCKGTRSAQLAANIGAINVEVDKFGDYLADLLPNMATKILGGFGKYAERLNAIQNAVTP